MQKGPGHRAAGRKAGEKFELFFWAVIFAAATLYLLLVFIPGVKQVDESEAALGARRAELAKKQAELKRNKAYVKALTATTLRIDTLERELRTRFGWSKPGETVIPID